MPPVEAPATGEPAASATVQILRLIEALIVRVFMVQREDLFAASRKSADIALARQVAMYLAHVVCNIEVGEVGRSFGRDRTTVRHACGVVEDSRDDPGFDLTLELLVGILRRLRDVSFPQPDLQ